MKNLKAHILSGALTLVWVLAMCLVGGSAVSAAVQELPVANEVDNIALSEAAEFPGIIEDVSESPAVAEEAMEIREDELDIIEFVAPQVAAAASGTVGDLKWSVSGSVLTLSGSGDTGNYYRSGMAPWAEYASSVTNIKVGKNVTGIGNNSFAYFSNLVSVSFASDSKCTRLGQSAFAYCPNLVQVTIPDSVTTMDICCFDNCGGLVSAIVGSKVTAIPNACFRECSNLREVTLGASITAIGTEAFYKDACLTSIKIPKKCTSIGSSAFCRNSSLEKVSFVDGSALESIDGSAFQYCYNLEEITIPAAVKTIGIYAFEQCSRLSKFRFAGTEASETEKSVLESIGSDAFKDCTSITDLVLPDSLYRIHPGAFSGCYGMKTLKLGKGLTLLDGLAFEHCSALEAITIPAACTSIGRLAFDRCSSLKTLKFAAGSKLTEIKDTAFRECDLQGEIVFPSNLITIEYSAFISNPNLRSIVLNDNCNFIGSEAFKDCHSLESVRLGAGLNTIESDAFRYCDLKKLEIPNKVTEIGRYAFYENPNLKTIRIGSGIQHLEPYTFGNCNGLTDVYIYSTNCGIDAGLFKNWYGDVNRNLTLHGFENSTTQSFAAANSYPFQVITKKKLTTDGFSLAVPNYDYDGQYHTPEVRNAGGLVSGLDYLAIYDYDESVGTHYVTIMGYCEYTGSVTLPYTIGKTDLANATVTLAYTTKAYAGSALKPTVTVKVGKYKIAKSNYTVSYKNNDKVGKATVTIKGKGGLTGSVKKTFTITKGTQPLKISPKSKSYTVSAVKKEAKKFTITATKNQGKVTYSSDSKYVTVTSKGAVTVKKGTPKGTYKITVKAAGNSNYKSGTKTVKVTVK